MQYFGGKLSAAQLQVAGWVGSLRRSLQGALELVWGQEKQEEDEDDKEEDEEGRNEGGRFQRAMSPLRSFARRSRRSLHRFSVRSRQTFQRRATEACSDQVNNFSTTNKDKDTDALIEFEADQEDGVGEETLESSSPQPAPDQVPEVSAEDTADTQKEPELAPFPESSAPLLDTSAQRSKADLGKRLIRTRPSRVLRARLVQKEPTVDSRTHDSLTDEKETPSKERESDSEDEQPKPKVACSQTQRVPVFPGMSPGDLLAQLKRRTGGGGTGVKEETVENKAIEEREHQDEEVAQSPSELPRSPRTPAHLAGATRVLPPIGGKGQGGASSPAWLQELKSKKRMSQYGGDA